MAQFTSAIDARASVLTGEATSAELVRSAIELITTLDQAGYELNSVLAQNADALEQAQAIDIDGKFDGIVNA